VDIENKRQPEALEQLVKIYVARRELVQVLKRELLRGESEVKLEEAEILLGLFRAKTGEYPAIPLDGKEFTGLKQIEAAQMLSQSQIHRRVRGLINSKYLEEKLPRRATGPIKVRLTEKGEAFAQQYWKDYKRLASMLLEGVDASERRSHLLVNDTIQRKILGMSMPRSAPSQKVEPIESLMSVFAAAKALRRAIESAVVLPEDKLSVERVDLLVYLYTQRGEFASFGQMQRNLVHSFSASRHLISRWISDMGPEKDGGKGYVKSQRMDKGGKRMEAAITQKGCGVVEPILNRYRKLEENLLAGISPQDRNAHLRVSKAIINSIRPTLKDLVSAAD
jgi:DNA-binding MarR family transcriptional regulator